MIRVASEDGWSVSRYARYLGLQRDQKERRIRPARIWEIGKTEEKGADGFQPQDAGEDQDPSQDRRQIPVAKAAKDAVLGVKK